MHLLSELYQIVRSVWHTTPGVFRNSIDRVAHESDLSRVEVASQAKKGSPVRVVRILVSIRDGGLVTPTLRRPISRVKASHQR